MKKNLIVASFALACALAGGTVHAQARKSVVAEPIAIQLSFSQWVQAVVAPLPAGGTDAGDLRFLDFLDAAPAPAAAPAVYHPKPVVLGHPELPLLGDEGSAAVGSAWGPTLNYQGMHVKMVLLDERGTARTVQPLQVKLRPGQRFKMRVTPTYDAVASVERLTGDTWSLRRVEQVYPSPGLSVQIRAGETVDLPIGASEYFVMPRNASPFVLNVRHPRAVGAAASEQPAYREDGARGSNYLQLVPPGQWPAIEQQVGAVR